MRCHDVHEWMSLKLDGSLPSAQEQELEAHLACCPACAEQWAAWQEIASLFEAAPMVQPPEGFSARVMARLDARPRWSAFLGSLGVMMAGLTLIGALLLAPWVQTCSMALQAVQTPGMLGVVAGVLADLVECAAMLAGAVRIALRATVTPQSALLVVGYGAILLAALTGWLRLVAFRPVEQVQ